ncbi:MAG: pyridoxal-dependent decarboxylase [Holophagales bacterium]|nr:pyridoxal-dependent decarboxylase [Holophagales bacterium]
MKTHPHETMSNSCRDQPASEIDLDPSDWQAFSTVAHEALDDAVAFLRDVRDRPPWRPLPPEVAADLDEPLPLEGTDLEDVYARMRRSVWPYPTGNVHPRFWGWVMGNGTAEGLLADLVASAMNNHLAGYDQSADHIERRVIRWMVEIMGYPADASGILVSGGTVANLSGIAVARRAKADWNLRDDGLYGGPRLTFYGSDETHSWAGRASDLLGLGRRGFVPVASGSDYRLDLDALARRVADDRRAGLQPFCVVGNAGTVNTGAIDDLEAIADFCRAEDLWFHVDGAFGALIALHPELRTQLRGMERSDSLAFDLHKWGYLQYELGCTLVRDAEVHQATFASPADYLEAPGRGILPRPLEWASLGIQLSRGFRALRLWTSLELHGVEKIGRVIAQNVEQAQYLGRRVEEEPLLELMCPVSLNVVCFRYRPPGSGDTRLDELNREILIRLQEEGIAIPSSTVLGGRFCLRVAITNHRSRKSDFDALVSGTLAIGARVAGRMPAGEPHAAR